MRPTATSVIVLLNPAECAKGIVDFMRHKACFCDYFLFVFVTLYYKCEIRLSACDEFINTDVYYFICTILVRF